MTVCPARARGWSQEARRADRGAAGREIPEELNAEVGDGLKAEVGQGEKPGSLEVA